MKNEETNTILVRIEHLLAAVLKTLLAETLSQIMSDKKLRMIYEMTGTGAPVAQIAKKAGTSTGGVSRIWQSWEAAGLIVKDGKSYLKLLG